MAPDRLPMHFKYHMATHIRRVFHVHHGRDLLHSPKPMHQQRQLFSPSTNTLIYFFLFISFLCISLFFPPSILLPSLPCLLLACLRLLFACHFALAATLLNVSHSTHCPYSPHLSLLPPPRQQCISRPFTLISFCFFSFFPLSPVSIDILHLSPLSLIAFHFGLLKDPCLSTCLCLPVAR